MVPLVVAWAAVLVWAIFREWDLIRSDGWVLAAWFLPIASVNLLPLRGWQSAGFVADFPILTAAALIFSPVETALLAFLACLEPQQLQRKTGALHTAFNSTQNSISWFIGATCAHALARDPSIPPYLIGLAFIALLANSGSNYLLVGLWFAVKNDSPIRSALVRMRIGSLADFLLMFLASGAMGVMLVVLYGEIGLWSLALIVPPVLITRQALLRSQMFIDARRAYQDREIALAHITHQIDRERADERRLIGADLHDEVLQPLFKVSLLAHVLKRDLATGKLLEMEDDLPELISAADEASETVRTLVGDLRRSGLGRGGLWSALTRLASMIQEQSDVKIHTSIEQVSPRTPIQLALYQIAKEALSNAVRHAEASNIWLELSADGPDMCLTVRDDGKGFNQDYIPADHFGVKIMTERAAAIQGSLYADTSPGKGTCITVVVRAGLP
jgi:signal transduction histidine kinase